MRHPLLALCLCACAGAAPTPTPEPAPTETTAEAIARVDGAARELGKTLKTRMVEAMGKGGPVAAITVCESEAVTLTRGVEERTQVAVGRSSLRLRNPSNAGPSWVTAWLESQGERKAAGVEPLREVVATPEGPEARVILPIAMEATCLACHGAPDQVPDEVKILLADAYPTDAATGYAEGDLRGALWAAARVR